MPLPLVVHRVTKRFVAGIPGCYSSYLALQRASLVVRPTEVVAVVGQPGSGKSALLLCAAGLLRPDAGAVWWFERYRDVGACSGLIRFARYGPETPGAIDVAIARGAKLLVIDGVDPSLPAGAEAALARSIRNALSGDASVLPSTRDAPTADALGARTVGLASGRTDVSNETALGRPAARVAESPVDPPFGWV